MGRIKFAWHPKMNKPLKSQEKILCTYEELNYSSIASYVASALNQCKEAGLSPKEVEKLFAEFAEEGLGSENKNQSLQKIANKLAQADINYGDFMSLPDFYRKATRKGVKKFKSTKGPYGNVLAV